jgi:hypothetical protein
MNVLRSLVSRCTRLAGALITCTVAVPVNAENVSITAVFKPDSAYPHLNKFKNTTPPSGYCAQHPEQCADNQMFSLQVPIQFDSRTPILANHASQRQGAMLKAPARWRELTVYHETTREPERVRVRIAGIGSRYRTDDVVELVGGADDYRAAHSVLWGSSWVNSPSPCLYSGVGWFTTTTYGFFWKTPTEAVCAKQAKFNVPWMRLEHLDFAYELETPNPLGMSSGHYTGSLNYSVGPHGDFDFGDVMLPSDSALTLNFNLDVQHTLKVDIPPGGEKVEMVPAGGWQSWLHAGRKPVRLFRDQTFNISASSRFKMYLDCQFGPGNYCYMNDGKNIFVPIDVSVSLPAGLMDGSGKPVSRQPLKVGEEYGVVFQPSQYVDRQSGKLHFELHKDAIDIVFAPNMPKRYSGTVVVIWDSEV